MSNLIGHRIRELRMKRGMTQTELARDIVTPSMISQIEAGKAFPSEGLLRKLAIRLDEPEDALLIAPQQNDAASARMGVIRACLAAERYQEAEDLIGSELESSPASLELYHVYAQLLLAQKSFKQATLAINECLRLMRLERKFELLPDVYGLQGDIFMAVGEYDTAAHAYRQALIGLRNRVQVSGLNEAKLAMRLSQSCYALGRLDEARTWAERANERVALGERSKSLVGDQVQAAIRALTEGHDSEALRLAAEARSLHDIFTWLESSGSTVLLLARQALARDDSALAGDLLASAKERSLLFASNKQRAMLLMFEAEWLLAQGDVDGAITLARQALSIDKTPTEEFVCGLLTVGEAALGAGQVDIAKELAQEAHAMALKQENLALTAKICARVGNIHFQTGDARYAESALSSISGTP